MRQLRYIGWIPAFLVCIFSFSSLAFAETGVSAKSALVMELSSGRVLYQKDADTPMPVASTTKILTALTALEHGDIKENVTVSPAAAAAEGSSMYLAAGETLPLEQLLYGLMLSSGNDAAVAIAEHFGTVEEFVAMMNQRHRNWARHRPILPIRTDSRTRRIIPPRATWRSSLPPRCKTPHLHKLLHPKATPYRAVRPISRERSSTTTACSICMTAASASKRALPKRPGDAWYRPQRAAA